MARFDGKFKAAGEVELDIEELFSSIPAAGKTLARGRQDAIACFLSASEGWEEAKGTLQGTFASAVRASWLREGKE